MKIFNIIEQPSFIPEMVSLIRSEWASSDKSEGNKEVEQRLCGDRIKGRLPIAFVAVDSAALMGFASIIHHELFAKEAKPTWVDTLYVLPPFRSRRIGTKLLQVCEEQIQLMGIECLYAYTDKVPFYTLSGWALDKPEDSRGLSVMRKKLI